MFLFISVQNNNKQLVSDGFQSYKLKYAHNFSIILIARNCPFSDEIFFYYRPRAPNGALEQY